MPRAKGFPSRRNGFLYAHVRVAVVHDALLPTRAGFDHKLVLGGRVSTRFIASHVPLIDSFLHGLDHLFTCSTFYTSVVFKWSHVMHTMELSTVYALLPYDDDGHTPLHFLKALKNLNDKRIKQSAIEQLQDLIRKLAETMEQLQTNPADDDLIRKFAETMEQLQTNPADDDLIHKFAEAAEEAKQAAQPEEAKQAAQPEEAKQAAQRKFAEATEEAKQAAQRKRAEVMEEAKQATQRAQSMIEFINTPIWGGTPLYWMRETPHAEQWLQQHGAEIVEPPTGISDMQDVRPEHARLHTELIWALIFDCQTSDHTLPRTTHFLRTLDRRALNAKEASGYTALMYAFMLPWHGGSAERDACVLKVLSQVNATVDLWDGTHTFITYLLQTPGCGHILSQSIGRTFFVRAQHKIWAAEHGLDEYMEWMLRHCDDNGSALDILYRRLPVGNISADSLFQSAWLKIRDPPSSVTNVPKYVEQVKMLTRHITKTKLADYIHEMLTNNRWLYFHGNALLLKNLLFHGDHPETIQHLQNKQPCVIDTHNKALIEIRLYTFDNQNSTVFAWFRARGIGFVLQNISLPKLAISDSEYRLMRQTFHFFDDVRKQIHGFDVVDEPRRIDHPRCKEHIQKVRFNVRLGSGSAIDRQITNTNGKYLCPVCRKISDRMICMSVPQVRNFIRVREEIRALEANVDESGVAEIQKALAALDKQEERAEKRLALETRQAIATERRAQRAAAAEYKADTAAYDKEVANHNLRGKQNALKRKEKTVKGAEAKLKKQRKQVTVVETLKF